MSLHKILSYCKSHIYELHALLAAFITFLMMLVIKRPIKSAIEKYIDRKAEQYSKWKRNRVIYRKRLNFVVIIVTIILAYVIFAIVAFISPMIKWSSITAFLTAVFALDIYAVFDQFRRRP